MNFYKKLFLSAIITSSLFSMHGMESSNDRDTSIIIVATLLGWQKQVRELLQSRKTESSSMTNATQSANTQKQNSRFHWTPTLA